MRSDSAPERLVELLRLIAQTPAPTGCEAQRGEVVLELWRAAGLAPERDAVGNVVAAVPGGSGPRVVLVAHLDSVFGPEVDVTVRLQGDVLVGPGVGDNAASLAVLTSLAESLPVSGPRPRLTLAA